MNSRPSRGPASHFPRRQAGSRDTTLIGSAARALSTHGCGGISHGRHASHASHVTLLPAPKTTHVAYPYAREVVIHLTAIQDCWVEFTTPGGGYLFQSYVVGGTSKTWTFRHAVDMRLGNPGGIRLTVDGKTPLPPGSAPPITLRLGLNGKISS